MNRLLPAFLFVGALIAIGCGDDSSATDALPEMGDIGSDADAGDVASDADAGDVAIDAGPAERFDLGGGLAVEVQGNALTLLRGEDVTFGLANGPSALTYDLNTIGGAGIWSFRRMNTTRTALARTGTTLDGATLRVDYTADDGTSAVLEIVAEGTERVRFRLQTTAAPTSWAIPVRCDDEGTFHGFGVQYNASDLRGSAFEVLSQEQGIGREGGALRAISGDEHTTYFGMPYYLDARGHGALFQTDELVSVDLCAANASEATIDYGGPVEWVVYLGPTPLDVIRQLGEDLGVPAALPDWAFGLWIGSQGGRAAVEAEVDAVEAANIPVAAFWVQDWTGRRMNIGGGFGVQYRWEADEDFYPDLAGLVRDLRARGYRFLAYANPFVDPALPNHFDEMAEQGFLVRNPDGEAYRFGAPNGEAGHPDFTNPDARAYVVDALRAMIRDYGFDGWMQDFAEWTPLDAVTDSGATGLAYHNRFTVEWQSVAREAFDAERPAGDYAFFGRSGWTGVQAVAQIHWIGDQEATWTEEDGLPTVVPGMLGMGFSGQPNTTHDIAGFSGGPSSKELFMRWTELGAFTPIMRTHEGDRRDENWSWESDAETTAHFRRFARVHDALFAEIRALADRAQVDSHPMVEHLMLAFPNDRESWNIDDQYLLGDLLVAPVTEEGATTREVYLPEGTWFHVWTGEEFAGNQRITIDAPIGSPPVFNRGSDRTDLRAIE
ncbi:MAG: TIM-barrel domain-containing protein [Myxococcota bacterium]